MLSDFIMNCFFTGIAFPHDFLFGVDQERDWKSSHAVCANHPVGFIEKHRESVSFFFCEFSCSGFGINFFVGNSVDRDQI